MKEPWLDPSPNPLDYGLDYRFVHDCKDENDCFSWYEIKGIYKNFTELLIVIDSFPKGVDLKDVKINFNYYASPFAVEHVYCKFLYKKKNNLNKQISIFKKDCETFNKEKLLPYIEEKKKYDNWLLSKEIKEAEEKLKKLKEDKNNL